MSADVQQEQSTVRPAVPGQQGRSGAGGASPRARPVWQRRYTYAVVANDLLSIIASATLYGLWGSADGGTVLAGTVLVTALTAAALATARAWEPAVLGQGSLEFTRLMRGFVGAAVIFGLVGLALQLPEARPWVFVVLPTAGGLAVSGRMGLRKRLHRLRN